MYMHRLNNEFWLYSTHLPRIALWTDLHQILHSGKRRKILHDVEASLLLLTLT